MRSRRSRAAVLEKDIAEVRARATDTLGELAEHAITIAREAGLAARPTVQHGAEGLSHALERAAGALAGTAEHLAASGGDSVNGAGNAARDRLADATESLAGAIRPKRRTHRVRRVLIGVAIVGGVIVLVQSPLRAKVQQRMFGPPPEDDELPAITLPDDAESGGHDAESGAGAETVTDIRGTVSINDGAAAEPAIHIDQSPN